MNRRGHEYVGLVRGKAKHEPLVSSALVRFIRFMSAQSNICRLLAYRVDDGTGVAIKTDIR